MLFAKSTTAVVLVATFVAAQNNTLDPNSVSPLLRSQWCNAEINTCGTLCSGNVVDGGNVCDSTTLSYNCTCSANNSAPGLAYYTQTMPTFICEQIFQNCIAAGVGDQAAQAVCNKNEKANCGHLNPLNFVAPAATTSSSSSSSAAATGSGASTTAASTSSSKAAAATMMAMGREYGSGVVAAGVAAAFGLML